MPRIFEARWAERGVEPDEIGRLEIGVDFAALADVMAEQRHLHQLRHVDAGILQQRSNVISGRAHHGVLEVKQADAGNVQPFAGSLTDAHL